MNIEQWSRSSLLAAGHLQGQTASSTAQQQRDAAVLPGQGIRRGIAERTGFHLQTMAH